MTIDSKHTDASQNCRLIMLTTRPGAISRLDGTLDGIVSTITISMTELTTLLMHARGYLWSPDRLAL